jgi:hypothetical protein
LEEAATTQVFVFPNPGKDIFNITGLPAGIVYEVYDLTGRLLIESDRNEINLGRYSSGIYLLKVNIKGHPQVVKISKE